MNVLGIMNGTSIDGVDLVLCQIQKSPFKCKLLGHASHAFPTELANQLRSAARHTLKVDALGLLHHSLGRYYAEVVKKSAKANRWKFDAIGLHGQTVFHSAPDATLQIGEGSYLRAEFEVPVVADFRVLDLAYGGQGAPIATLFHQQVLAPLAKAKCVAVQNLGGIANVSYFDKKKSLAFDTGPANMLIDLAVTYLTEGKLNFDRDAELAKKGIPAPGVMKHWLDHSYFAKRPPKSCGREEFGEAFLQRCLEDLRGQSKEDIVSTITEFTAVSLADAYARFLPQTPEAVVLCGGGAKNSYLASRIQYHLPKSRVLTSAELGWPVETIEGAAFALLAAYRLWEKPSNIPQTTGARKAVSLGKIL